MSLRGVYHLAQRAVGTLGPRLAPADSKIARGSAGRSEVVARYVAWAARERDSARPLFWFHAPSVGEGHQAKAVLDAVRALEPDAQFVFTHFSPSAERFAERVGADVAGYLPWDLPGPMRTVLGALRPTAVVFTKTEIWPTLVDAASRRGTAVGLVAGAIQRDSGRHRGVARRLLGPGWASLGLLAACSEDDRDGFVELGVARANTVVTGDPGLDSAARRASAADPHAPHLAPFASAPGLTVVCGSTWSADEEVLLPALAAARQRFPGVRTIVAPHEPSEDHVVELMGRLAADGWAPERLSRVEDAGGLQGADAVVVDGVGKLAELYTAGDIAYVGGGFHDEGLHSVLEPAAAGLPVVFGPKHGNARAAAALLREGGAKLAQNRDELENALLELLSGEESRRATGRNAFGYIDRHRGAAERTAEHLLDRLAKSKS